MSAKPKFVELFVDLFCIAVGATITATAVTVLQPGAKVVGLVTKPALPAADAAVETK